MINCPLLNITVQKSNIVTISINPVMSLKKDLPRNLDQHFKSYDLMVNSLL